jgi:regulatory protein YycI of two-component signal transduction system YycFG
MESKKIKDIVLFVLLLVNLFLLVLVVVRQREALRSRETIIRNTVTVFEENGIV